MKDEPPDKLFNEYTAAAAEYDSRWKAYLDASLRMTMDVVDELPRRRVLDVACGTGLLLEMLADGPGPQELVGIDRVSAMLEKARQRLGDRAVLLEAESTHLPFDDAKFELVVCTNALHYFADTNAALKQMRRVLSKSGHLVLTDWCRDYLSMRVLNRVLPWTRFAHTHTFGSREIEQDLSHAGFKVIKLSRAKIDWFWGLMTIHAVPV